MDDIKKAIFLLIDTPEADLRRSAQEIANEGNFEARNPFILEILGLSRSARDTTRYSTKIRSRCTSTCVAPGSEHNPTGNESATIVSETTTQYPPAHEERHSAELEDPPRSARNDTLLHKGPPPSRLFEKFYRLFPEASSMVNQDPIKTLGEPLETVDKRLNDLENMCSTPRALMRRGLCQQSLARDFYDWEVGMYKHSHVEQVLRDWKQGQASKKGYTSEYARTKSADKQVCERIRKAISHGTKLLWLNKFAPELPRLSIFLMLSSVKNHISYKDLAELVTDIRSTTATDNNSANSDCSRRMSFIMFVRTECSWTTRASDLYGEQITANISTRKRKRLDTEAAPPPSSGPTDCLHPSSSIPIDAHGFDPQIASSYYSSGIPVDETFLDQFPLLPQYPFYLSSQHSDGVVVSEMALYQHFLPSQYASYE